jgi:hypothetical protein
MGRICGSKALMFSICWILLLAMAYANREETHAKLLSFVHPCWTSDPAACCNLFYICTVRNRTSTHSNCVPYRIIASYRRFVRTVSLFSFIWPSGTCQNFAGWLLAPPSSHGPTVTRNSSPTGSMRDLIFQPN